MKYDSRILDVNVSEYFSYLLGYYCTIVSRLSEWNTAVYNCYGCLSISVPRSITCDPFMPNVKAKLKVLTLKNTTTYIFVAYITFSDSVIVCLHSRISQSWFCCMICCFSLLPAPPIQNQRLSPDLNELIPLITGDGVQKHLKHAGGPPHNHWSGIRFSNGIKLRTWKNSQPISVFMHSKYFFLQLF